ncbi:MAG: hypothetical protein R6W90_01055 [Ignavibacteriaceae bacterium]
METVMRRSVIISLFTFLILFSTAFFVNAQDTTGTEGNTGMENTTGTESTTGVQDPFGTDTTGVTGQTGTTGMPQNDDTIYETHADQWSQSLADELSLDASQRDSVKTILLDYQRQRAALSDQVMDENMLTEFNSNFNSRIQGLLDENQATSYNNYRQSWWNDINTTISNTSKNDGQY